jgi:hypothetical protein
MRPDAYIYEIDSDSGKLSGQRTRTENVKLISFYHRPKNKPYMETLNTGPLELSSMAVQVFIRWIFESTVNQAGDRQLNNPMPALANQMAKENDMIKIEAVSEFPLPPVRVWSPIVDQGKSMLVNQVFRCTCETKEEAKEAQSDLQNSSWKKEAFADYRFMTRTMPEDGADGHWLLYVKRLQ